MENMDFIAQLTLLTSQDNKLAVSRDVSELRSKFDDFLIEEERKAQVAALEAQEQGENVEVDLPPNPLKAEFYAIYSAYKEARNAQASAKKLEQEANLRLKKKLIEQLRTLIQEEENIGVAVNSYKEIHEAWKAVGDIPRENRQDIQSEYSKMLESFFHNLKIYRELKDNDLKRNGQLKTEVASKIEALISVENIKEMEAAIKVLQNEFDEIGPVPNEEWDSLKERYWEAVKAVYAKIHTFYDVKREELKENIAKKEALLAEAKTLVENLSAEGSKEWDELTKNLLLIQENWKKVGFGTKKENEELWAEFRSVCDIFFAQKKAFYDSLRTKFDEIAAKKTRLIERVVALKDSTDWKQTTDTIVRLQQDWKKLGNAGQRNEQTLWKEFRAACDSFFNSKQRHFDEMDKENEVNLAAKIDVIEKIEAYKRGEDIKQVIHDLKEFSAAFNAVGKVPFKQKDEIYQRYKKAIDALYSELKLEGAEKEKVVFQAKMDSLKANPNSEKLIENEKRDIRQQIQTLQQDILQYENNLGFFSNAKGDNPMVKEVQAKIAANNRKVDELKRKLKLFGRE